MNARLFGFLGLSALLFACGGSPYSAPIDSAPKNNDGDSSPASTAPASSVDGTWDVTSSDGLGPSSITLKGNSITGAIVADDERGDLDCAPTKDRWTIVFTVNGDKLTGTMTRDLAYTSDCGESESDVTKVTATRAATKSGATPFEGDWTVATTGSKPFTAKVAGLITKILDSDGDLRLSTTISGNDLTGSGTGENTFAAKKR